VDTRRRCPYVSSTQGRTLSPMNFRYWQLISWAQPLIYPIWWRFVRCGQLRGRTFKPTIAVSESATHAIDAQMLHSQVKENLCFMLKMLHTGNSRVTIVGLSNTCLPFQNYKHSNLPILGVSHFCWHRGLLRLICKLSHLYIQTSSSNVSSAWFKIGSKD
jgi:hypothetical protein